MPAVFFTDECQYVLRIVVACLVGMVMGLDRNFHGKSAGLRTYSLVSVASAGAVLFGIKLEVGFGVQNLSVLTSMSEANALSRIVQGVLQGIGFLGAGVIIHGKMGKEDDLTVHGLTTAASIWLTAILGIISGLGMWLLLAASMFVVLFVLIAGGRIERWMLANFIKRDKQ